MDKMFLVHKNEFVAAMNSVIDILQNGIDSAETKKHLGAEIDEQKLNELKDNCKRLNQICYEYKVNNTLKEKDIPLVISSLATVAVNMEYLSKYYLEAAKKAKIIIANIQAKSHS